MLTRLANRPLLVALLIGFAAEMLFAWQLARPHQIVFDEVHYVNAARTMMELQVRVNAEHPLVGKTLIALGIALFGDNPIGWRAFSTLAGTATVLGCYWLLWLGWRRVSLAVFGAFLCAVNQLVYVQARIGMLDGFLAAFLVLGIAALVWVLQVEPARRWRRLMLSAVLFGLAVGTKWAAIPYEAAACIAILLHGRAGPVLKARTNQLQVLAFGGLSILVYLFSFWPDMLLLQEPLKPLEVIPFQWAMYQLQTVRLPHHPYQSSWWTWPLMIRPIWYFYQQDAGIQRGVLLIGNPAIMWGGLAAVAAAIWAGVRGADRRLLSVGLLWVFSILVWAIIPKSLGFYYYYYLSGIWLCLVIPPVIDKLVKPRWSWAAEAFAALSLFYFVYFFPILSGAPLSDAGAFAHWMWFDSWR